MGYVNYKIPLFVVFTYIFLYHLFIYVLPLEEIKLLRGDIGDPVIKRGYLGSIY